MAEVVGTADRAAMVVVAPDLLPPSPTMPHLLNQLMAATATAVAVADTPLLPRVADTVAKEATADMEVVEPGVSMVVLRRHREEGTAAEVETDTEEEDTVAKVATVDTGEVEQVLTLPNNLLTPSLLFLGMLMGDNKTHMAHSLIPTEAEAVVAEAEEEEGDTIPMLGVGDHRRESE